MNHKNTIFTAIFGVLLLAVLGFYIYQDLSKEKINNEQQGDGSVATTTQDANIDISVDGGEGVIITPIEIEPETQASAPDNYPIPDLERQIVFPADFSEDARAIALENIAKIKQALENNPQSFGDWIDLGLYRKMFEDYEGARLAWKYAIHLNPLASLPYGNLGDLNAFYLHNNEKAEEYYLKAIELGPKQEYLYSKIVEFYTEILDENEKALKIVQNGLIHSPNSQYLQELLQYLIP